MMVSACGFSSARTISRDSTIAVSKTSFQTGLVYGFSSANYEVVVQAPTHAGSKKARTPLNREGLDNFARSSFR